MFRDVSPEQGHFLAWCIHWARKVYIQLLDYDFEVPLANVVRLPLGSAAMLASLLHKKEIDGFILRLVPLCKCCMPFWRNGRVDGDPASPFPRMN